MVEQALRHDTLQFSPLIKQLKSEPVIDTVTGISLVPFDGTEAPEHEKWFSDQDVTRYLHPNTPFTTDPNQRVSAKEFVDYMTASPEFAFFRIIHPRHGFIGHVSMNGINLDEMSFERAITIGEKQYWGQGIGSAVGSIILNHAKELGFRVARASTKVDNTASLRNLTRQYGPGKPNGDYIDFELDLATYSSLLDPSVSSVQSRPE
ncbi:GNAT family N-acetyltransferase [Candidatus Roizmanbacteria bacterium]|nr:MAG: GNAT family N-acetyltransferase [Candidatus Roizmanbacteria bacterium]